MSSRTPSMASSSSLSVPASRIPVGLVLELDDLVLKFRDAGAFEGIGGTYEYAWAPSSLGWTDKPVGRGKARRVGRVALRTDGA